jgi:hypothetical protein
VPRSETRVKEDEGKIQDAVVQAAISAAEKGTPNIKRQDLPRWQIEEIERRTGWRLTQKEAKEALGTALHLGQLRYIKGTNRQCAGYYPPDEGQAHELARRPAGAEQGGKPVENRVENRAGRSRKTE